MEALLAPVYDGMDYLCGRPVFPREQRGAFSVRADAARPVWTHASVGAGPLVATPFPGCDTVYATFQYAVAKNGTRPAVGMRALVKARARSVASREAEQSQCCAGAAARCAWALPRTARSAAAQQPRGARSACAPHARAAPRALPHPNPGPTLRSLRPFCALTRPRAATPDGDGA
jgi:hypothetical protein